MGSQLTAYMQKYVDGKWINIDILPRHDYELDKVNTCYCRDEVHGSKHWDWLGLSSLGIETWGLEVPPHITPKGPPEDLLPGSEEWNTITCYGEQPNYPFAQNWEMVDNLLATDWDKQHEFYDGQPARSLREHLGQPFIDWLQSLKDKGVERMVYCFD